MSQDRVWLAACDADKDESRKIDRVALMVAVGAMLESLATPFIAIKDLFRKVFR